MSRLVETVIASLQDLLSEAIKALPGLLTGIIIVCLTRYVAQFIEKIAERTGKKALRNPSLQILLTKTAQVGVWTSGILLACVVAFPGLALGDIIATLGIGTVAIGFAFQDIAKNFLAGIILLVEEPFRMGDEVVIDDYQGRVEHISIRTTEIRTYEGEKILLPNATVFTNAVRVKTAYVSRRTDLAVGVDYNTSLAEASQVLAGAIASVPGVLSEPSPEVDLVEFGDSSINLIVRYWTLPQQKQARQVKTKAILAIKTAFDAARINIPYPIRTLYYYNHNQYHDCLPVK
ncbi:MscS Mechanosensitive ion channel [Stanieria cyanosphaera PCC 7437]|uniref:MscS Mechanosensitive ion channel n=1 Tax=Stanieria cyanosphaera (strain ATCC 29371 / PCC 7437) TaxID=111780 RepID=K9XNT4_STAC7|nr:mechanosensitive ion channel family protein [Stanieria cyanosphaera]AFZ33701.1 MscS Mechanosensitive ion channel [Stanieria cyanosphaera PCC 7437]